MHFSFCINVCINLVQGYGLIPLPPIKLKYVFSIFFYYSRKQHQLVPRSWVFSIVNFLFCDKSTSIAKYLESLRNFFFVFCTDLTLTPSCHHINLYHSLTCILIIFLKYTDLLDTLCRLAVLMFKLYSLCLNAGINETVVQYTPLLVNHKVVRIYCNSIHADVTNSLIH